MPKIVACGGRSQAYRSFRTAQENTAQDGLPILLVDSEEPEIQRNRWEHVASRDQWQRPSGATEDQILFMVQAMEAWFHADKNMLGEYYGQGFREAALSPRHDVENIPKIDLISGLQRATKDCQKGEYAKGDHSFQILACLDPAKVRASSPHAELFLKILDQKC